MARLLQAAQDIIISAGVPCARILCVGYSWRQPRLFLFESGRDAEMLCVETPKRHQLVGYVARERCH
jgi:hypothetical protein